MDETHKSSRAQIRTFANDLDTARTKRGMKPPVPKAEPTPQPKVVSPKKSIPKYKVEKPKPKPKPVVIKAKKKIPKPVITQPEEKKPDLVVPQMSDAPFTTKCR